MKLNSNDITNQKLVAWHGRVYQDKQKTHFFYTGSGFSLRLKGSKLSATFDVDYISESEKPYIKVIVKDSIKEKEFIYGLDKGIHTIVLFEGALNDYDVEIKKRSESMKSRTALIDFESDGNFKELNQKQIKYSIEWIGDSLTCGYGNLGATPDTPFGTKDEDGFNAFPILASNRLDAEYQLVCVSGIGMYKSLYVDVPMPNIYEKYDIYDPKQYPFDKTHDLIVVNLGSNDNTYLTTVSREMLEEEKEAFKEAYIKFIKRVQTLNPKSKILCISQGKRQTYVDELIEQAYRELDKNIFSHLRLSDRRIGDGNGSQYHPKVITHQRWAIEIADKINEII